MPKQSRGWSLVFMGAGMVAAFMMETFETWKVAAPAGLAILGFAWIALDRWRGRWASLFWEPIEDLPVVSSINNVQVFQRAAEVQVDYFLRPPLVIRVRFSNPAPFQVAIATVYGSKGVKHEEVVVQEDSPVRAIRFRFSRAGLAKTGSLRLLFVSPEKEWEIGEIEHRRQD